MRTFILFAFFLLLVGTSDAQPIDCADVEICHDPLRDVYFIVDISSSVEQSKVDTVVKDYLKSVYCLFFTTDSTPTLRPQIGLGVFSGLKIYNLLDLQSYDTEQDWIDAVDGAYASGFMTVFGNTPMAEAFNLARQVFALKGVPSNIQPGRLRHAIMITDGEPNPLINIAPSPNNVPPMDTPLKNPIENGNLTFDFYQQDAVATRPVPSYACGTLYDRFNPPAAVASSIPGCRVRTLSQYLFTDVYTQAQTLINSNVRVSAIALPDKFGVRAGLELVKGKGNDNLKCKASPGYCPGDTCYCRLYTEGKCVCSVPKGPLISTPIELNIFNAEFTVDSLLQETRNILCPDTAAPTPAIVTKAPTTKSPTTDSPTTNVPTTGTPTTNVPTTGTPTTNVPTTGTPTTYAPTTGTPTTYTPTTGTPTTYTPTTGTPTTKAPTTKAPTTKAPTTKAPTTKAPTTKAPTTKAPTTKAPTTTCLECDNDAWVYTWNKELSLQETLIGSLSKEFSNSKVGDYSIFWNGTHATFSWELCDDWVFDDKFLKLYVGSTASSSFQFTTEIAISSSNPLFNTRQGSWTIPTPSSCKDSLHAALKFYITCFKTLAPTTAAPTTAKPTTRAPTPAIVTKTPTTKEPTTKAPSTTQCSTDCSEETGWALGSGVIKFSQGWGGYFSLVAGQSISGNIMAGQYKVAGTYTITWSSSKYVSFNFQLCSEWDVTKTVHFYYGSTVPGSNPGSFNWKKDLYGEGSYSFVTSSAYAPSGVSTIYVALHLEVGCDCHSGSFLQVRQDSRLRSYDKDEEQEILAP